MAQANPGLSRPFSALPFIPGGPDNLSCYQKIQLSELIIPSESIIA
jgi:hypothetical protein